jgi:hypothetical protein
MATYSKRKIKKTAMASRQMPLPRENKAETATDNIGRALSRIITGTGSDGSVAGGVDGGETFFANKPDIPVPQNTFFFLIRDG